MEKEKDSKNMIKSNGKVHCTALCPKCGADLYYFEKECICKNKKCSWTCGGCKE